MSGDLESRCRDAFRSVLEFVRTIHDSANWSVYQEDQGVTYSTHAGTVEQDVVRGQTTVAKSIDQVFAFLSNPFNKREFDQVLTTLDVIEEYENLKCIFYQNNLPWPLDSRETVYAEGIHRDADGTILILGRSIPAEEVPIDEGFIRANMILCGHVMKPTAEGFTSLTSYFYIDPLGNLPETAKINAGKQQANAMLRIKQKIESS